MITEKQRQILLRTLASVDGQKELIQQEYLKRTGKKLTDEQIDEAINNLRNVRGV